MILTVTVTKDDARRADLIAALESVLSNLKNTCNWTGVAFGSVPATVGTPIIGNWEVSAS